MRPDPRLIPCRMFALDASVGRVVDALDAVDLAGTTVLIFTSDNAVAGAWQSMRCVL